MNRRQMIVAALAAPFAPLIASRLRMSGRIYSSICFHPLYEARCRVDEGCEWAVHLWNCGMPRGKCGHPVHGDTKTKTDCLNKFDNGYGYSTGNLADSPGTVTNIADPTVARKVLMTVDPVAYRSHLEKFVAAAKRSGWHV